MKAHIEWAGLGIILLLAGCGGPEDSPGKALVMESIEAHGERCPVWDGERRGLDHPRERGIHAAPPRFWALTPTYFLGIPFVFDDDHASFEKLGEQLDFEGQAHDQVKVTYAKEAGDSPDGPGPRVSRISNLLEIRPSSRASDNKQYVDAADSG